MGHDSIIPFVITAAMLECTFEFVYVDFVTRYGEVNEYEKELWDSFPDATEMDRRRALVKASEFSETTYKKRRERTNSIISHALSELSRHTSFRWEASHEQEELTEEMRRKSPMEEIFTEICTVGEGRPVYRVAVSGGKWPTGEYMPMRKISSTWKKCRVLRGHYSAWSTILALLDYKGHEFLINVYKDKGYKGNGGRVEIQALVSEVEALRHAATDALETNGWICLWELFVKWKSPRHAPFSFNTTRDEYKREVSAVAVQYGYNSEEVYKKLCHLFYKYRERACHKEYKLTS